MYPTYFLEIWRRKVRFVQVFTTFSIYFSTCFPECGEDVFSFLTSLILFLLESFYKYVILVNEAGDSLPVCPPVPSIRFSGVPSPSHSSSPLTLNALCFANFVRPVTSYYEGASKPCDFPLCTMSYLITHVIENRNCAHFIVSSCKVIQNYSNATWYHRTKFRNCVVKGKLWVQKVKIAFRVRNLIDPSTAVSLSSVSDKILLARYFLLQLHFFVRFSKNGSVISSWNLLHYKNI